MNLYRKCSCQGIIQSGGAVRKIVAARCTRSVARAHCTPEPAEAGTTDGHYKPRSETWYHNTMQRWFFLTISIPLVFVGSFLARGLLDRTAAAIAPGPRECRRIVSMAPSVTETLFALGLGERVVGVSQFCDYPPEARTRAKIGGYLDPNFEAILGLRPDLVVLLVEDEQSATAFRKLGLPTLAVCHKNIEGILDSLLVIGRACDAESAARQLRTDLQARLDRVQRKTAGLARPRVMVVAGRTPGGGKLEDLYIAASDGHLDRLVELAGGQNAYSLGAIHFPTVSSEGVLKIDPDVIIDLVSEASLAELGRERMLADWRQVAQVAAVRNNRVYLVADDRAARPGPGFVLLLERFARLIHPEVDW
jgi:iron complex transport system substrate-binding protein